MLNRIRSSITAKIFIILAAVLTISSLLIYMVVMVVMPKSYEVEENALFSQRTDLLVQTLETVSRSEAASIIEKFCLKNNTTAILQNGEEKQQFGSLQMYEKNKNMEASVSQSAFAALTFTDSSTAYTLIMVQSLQTVDAIAAIFYQIFPWIFLFILTVSIAGAWGFSFLLSKPVLEICSISRRMSLPDLTWRCNINRKDELGVLAASLNTMAEKISENMEALEEANRQLQEDMLREKEHEKQRRIFFAAVSHELKTPVTILRGQLESMIYEIGDYKNKDKYLPDSLETVDHMENLIKEILMVSKLSSDEIKPELSPVNLKELLHDCVSLYEPLAAQKQLRLQVEAEEEVTEYVDEKYFRKVVSNLLGNAVAYSPCGEFIEIKLTKTQLSIENSGIHIPEEKLSAIFSPFYRMEQSRNKNTGGSGLGLYIVKMILELHGIEYGIHNTESGVLFLIQLSQDKNK